MSLLSAIQRDWITYAFLSLLSVGMGVMLLLQIDPKSGIPDRGALIEAQGSLAWAQKYKYGTRFGLVGVAENFNYPSKANGMEAVRDALANSGTEIIIVEYQPSSSGPAYTDKKYHDVWALSVDGMDIRTYEETAEAWSRDNRLAPWLGAAMLFCGLYIGRLSWQMRRQAQQSPQADGPATGGPAA